MEHIQSWSVWALIMSNTVLVGASRYPVRIRSDSIPYRNTTLFTSANVATPPPTQTVSISSSLSEPEQNTINGTIDPSSSQCVNSTVTYTDYVPATVYTTVDSSYEVTVTASNASIPTATILETPPFACMTTVVYSNDPPDAMSAEVSAASSESPLAPSMTYHGTIEGPPLEFHTTSTVVITKKTPVPVVQIPSATSSPPVTFAHPKSDVPISAGAPNPTQNAGSDQGNGSGTKGPGNNNNPGGESPGLENNNALPAATTQNPEDSLASIVASVINLPFAISTPQTANFVAASATPTINDIPVTIGPSVVVIGSSTLPLPSSSQVTVVYSGATLTIRPTEIVAPTTTYRIVNEASSPVSTITQAPSTVTIQGVAVVVGPTQAVISGTTYRIGSDAKSTTIILNGQTISLGVDGVGFPGSGRTTIVPAMTIAGGYRIIVVDGLTLSVDQTQAVISGTTLKIGAGATSMSLVVDGTTISAGPDGVGLPSTTIMPTSVPTAVTASATSSASTQPSILQASASRSFAGTSRFSTRGEAFRWLVALLSPFFLFV